MTESRAKVGVKLDLLINLGNFSNVRTEISIEDYARPGETASAAVDRVYALVDHKLNEKVTTLRKALEKSGVLADG
jgi:hypothetical protein